MYFCAGKHEKDYKFQNEHTATHTDNTMTLLLQEFFGDRIWKWSFATPISRRQATRLLSVIISLNKVSI
jgi:hypothetical protein